MGGCLALRGGPGVSEHKSWVPDKVADALEHYAKN